MSIERDLGPIKELSQRFQMRMIELAKQGHFGSLRTRNGGLQSAYTHLLSLLDNPEVPVLIYGEKGAGKRRHVDELLQMHNFFRKLDGYRTGKLKVFRGDFVTPGFSQMLLNPQTTEADVIYLEGVDLLSLPCQEELLAFLKQRKNFADKGLPLPRLIIGTERALSILIVCGEFNRELFQAISGFALFLPTLRERSEDIPHFLQVFSEEITSKAQTPPAWLVDFVSKQDLPGNFEELQRILRQGLMKNSELARWTSADLPPEFQPRPMPKFEREEGDTARIRGALVSAKGDRRMAAGMLGIPYTELLQRMVNSGAR